MMEDSCRCGHRLIGELCFGCDLVPEECTCDDFIVLRSSNPFEIRGEMTL